MICAPLYAAMDSMSVISITPANPAPGDLVAVSFSYCTAAYDVSHLILAVSSYSSIQADNTGGQTFKVNADGIDIGGSGDGETASNNAGYNMNDSQGASHCQTLTWSIHIPNTLADATTYYVVVAGRSYDCRPGAIDTQNYISFTTPPPATGCSITKTAETSPVEPGGLVMYTIDYTYANATGLVITDTIPPYCTLVSQSGSGTNTGTTPGSTLSWAVGSSYPRVTGKVWYVVKVDASAPYSTAINGKAHWVINEIPAGGDSNDPTVMTAAPLTLLKTQNPASPAAMAIGDTVTYTLSLNAGNMVFDSYSTFDSDISGFHDNGGAGVWAWNSGGYLYSQTQSGYPHYLKNTPADFCFGEIDGDVYIINGTDNDALISFRDGGTTASCAYGVGISPDGNNGSAGTAFWVQKFCGAVGGYKQSVPATISLNTWYTEKILVTDAGNSTVRIRAKVWARGSSEPSSWMIDWTDASGSPAPCGYVGFQGNGTNANYYDNLKILRSTQTYPVVYDTIPAIITYAGGSAADTTHGAAINSGGTVSWNLFTSLADTAYSLTWWGTVNYCGDAYNKFSLGTKESAVEVDSNSVTLNVAICPQSPTFTPSFTDSPTQTPTYTATATGTMTPTFTATPTVTFTATPTATPIVPLLELTKTVNSLSAASAGAGETVTYNIHIQSMNPAAAANNIVVWDTLPAKHTFAAGGPAGVFVSYNSATSVITWNISGLSYGTAGTDVWFTTTMDSSINKGETFSNTAYAGCDGAPGVFTSNTTNLSANVPELSLTDVGNYPNPFEGVTTIKFTLSVQAECTLKVFTISGEPVRAMTWNEFKANLKNASDTKKGVNEVYWDGKNNSDKAVASGVYFYKIEASRNGEKKNVISRLAVIR